MLRLSNDRRYLVNTVNLEHRRDTYTISIMLGLDLSGSLVEGRLYPMKGSVSYRQLLSDVYLVGQLDASVSLIGEVLGVSLSINVIEGEDGFGGFILRDLTTVIKPLVVTDILEEILSTGVLDELVGAELVRLGFYENKISV